MCQDEEEKDMFQCEWIGCYSDIIDHLQCKCQFGTFITQEAIDRTKFKYYSDRNKKKELKSKEISNKRRNDNKHKSDWEISRAEITTYIVRWEQICEQDVNLGNHVDKKSVDDFFMLRFYLNQKELNKLWYIVGNTDKYVEENQFYAALHITRLHQNAYKPNCDLNNLHSLPACLTANSINQIRYSSTLPNGTASDLQTITDSMGGQKKKEKRFHEIYDKKNTINLDTKIGTMRQLKAIAGHGYHTLPPPPETAPIVSTTKQKQQTNPFEDDLNWNITKADIEKYKKWFSVADENNDGYIDGREGRKFFSKSKLENRELALIWSKIDIQKHGKLTEVQFYIFMHIILTIKKAQKKLPSDFILPPCLQESNVLKLMNHDIDDDEIWSDFGFDNVSSSQSNNILDGLNNPNNRRKQRSDSIDSIHDWGQFNFEF